MIRHIDLFSGIGGAALAVDTVWPGSEHTFVEIDKFCQAVLKKNFPTSQIYGDIRSFTAGAEEPPFILTGGFPCQPFSQAGRRKGTSDNRHLWPEMLRVIREFRPRWIVGENVAGLLTIEAGVVFESVCTDLEGAGYAVQAFVIPAAAVGAPHRRDRVWIVAHADGSERDREERRGVAQEIKKEGGFGKDHDAPRQPAGANERIPEDGIAHGHDGASANSDDPRERASEHEDNAGRQARADERQDELQDRTGGHDRPATYAERERSSQGPREVAVADESPYAGDGGYGWERHWLEVATELCRVDDGIPTGLYIPCDNKKCLDYEKHHIVQMSNSRHRIERLKGLGNAWVPQVAIEIMKGIKEIESRQ